MASLTLITISLFAVVLAISTRTCYGEIHHLPSSPYTETHLPSQHHRMVVYVPVCTPDCFKSSHQQSHLSSSSPINPEKTHIGNLPLQDHGQTYHPHLDVGAHHSLQSHQQSEISQYSSGVAQNNQHIQYLNQENQHFQDAGISQKEDSGSASVYQKNNHHTSEQKHEIHHHGSGVSQQVFKQEHNHHVDLSQVRGIESDESDEAHHKKNHNVNYHFEYSVNDPKTKDVKSHREDRKGDVVNGEYSLLEEDGNVRTVKYFADWKTGFHAQVHNSKTKSLG